MSSFSLRSPSKMIPSVLRSRLYFNFFSSGCLRVNPRNCSIVSLSAASVAGKSSAGVDFAWVSWDGISPDEYNGWDFFEESPDRNGFRAFAVAGAVASIVVSVCWRELVSFAVPLSNAVPIDALSEEISSNEQLVEDAKGSVVVAGNLVVEEELKPARILLPSAMDSTQQESLLSLKKLGVIEENVQGEELCTRREYARWLVRANTQLERSRKHRINTCAVLSGSSFLAFDDVGVEDPDFEFIQCKLFISTSRFVSPL
ncbi:hypothetical protein M569_00634 [Genlisea aurea]|uniref:Uncharacterized protein n=1 Tax=Genlisea aurea TaxID=192259 RepID=S8EDS6_9LAMI|nr:hypothetical protein M569_00634 [Genlisea aurea]